MNKKIYIIEDDANISLGLRAKFSDIGINITLDDGTKETQTVLRSITKNMPDYIILDLILPRLDGIEMLRAIKSDENIYNIPVFIFTDLSEKNLKEKCDNNGADYYYIKDDFNLDQFVEKVTKIIKNRDKQ